MRALVLLLPAALLACGGPLEEAPVMSAPRDANAGASALATFGGGCFWCTEAVFKDLEGVREVTSGYAGGHVERPTYKEVCEGTTGHAEVIQVRYDPAVTPYADLLRVFFATHDPTTLNRQGGDVGTQYRSVVFFHDDAQRKEAEAVKRELELAGAYDAPIVTEVSPYTGFWPAEDYHQDYFELNPNQGYCRAVIAPKVEKFRRVFADRLRPR
jgi:peptide-methionine (S)-S-oxide reductase